MYVTLKHTLNVSGHLTVNGFFMAIQLLIICLVPLTGAAQLQSSNVCQQRPNTGGCRKSEKVTRFIYDKNMGTCLRIKACANQNGNNFQNRQSCKDLCMDVIFDQQTQTCDDNRPCRNRRHSCVNGYCVNSGEGEENIDPCDTTRCPVCHKCFVNGLGDPKCVYTEGCCSAPSTSNCLNDPCESWQQLCPEAAYCIPMYCNGCKRKLYDKYFDEIPDTECTNGINENKDNPCFGVNCGRCKTCVPFSSNCIGTHCKPYTCVDNPTCQNSGNSSSTATNTAVGCANVLCTHGMQCQMVDGIPQCINQQCTMQLNSGPCTANITAWYYDGHTRHCEQFSYGGCGGNQNRFDTKEICERTCVETSESIDQTSQQCSLSCREGYECKTINGNEECVQQQTITRQHSQCSLPKLTGPCTDRLQRWFYNFNSGQCEQFIYGGCLGNENRFETRDKCEATCTQRGAHKLPEKIKGASRCALQKDPGPCTGSLRKWFYNSQTGNCELFFYGGCSGNQNRFDTKELCERFCAQNQDQDTSVCNLPKDHGPCTGSFRMWYFNSQTGQCEQFTYSGCGGNNNRFETQELCETRCDSNHVFNQCLLRCRPGYKCDNRHGFEQCVPESGIVEKCSLPKDPGPCTGAFIMWYYNYQANNCEQFVYGGCSGNENRFQTRQACESACSQSHNQCSLSCQPGYECKTVPGFQECVPISNPAQKCNLPKDSGPCRGNFVMWYFNAQQRRCEQFTYGGCGGNENQFRTKEMCERTCSHIPGPQHCSLTCSPGYECKIAQGFEQCVPISPLPNECNLPRDTGPCRASITMWYYNARNGRCEQFTYGGCQGNRNRFDSKQLCENRCSRNKWPQKCSLPCQPGYECKVVLGFEQCVPVQSLDDRRKCSLPKDPGPCRGNLPMWHFNPQTRRCEQFIYGGCGGNENRFESRQRCEQCCLNNQEPRQCSLSCKPGYVCKFQHGLEQCLPAFDIPSQCILPKEPGPCRGRIPKWYFDVQTMRCEQFVYGGCSGNQNQFDTREICEITCSQKQRPCSLTCRPGYECQIVHGFEQCVKISRDFDGKCNLPKDAGHCFGYIPSWYYNPQSQQCEQFIYGGCGGNENRFETQPLCERACSPLQRCPAIEPPRNLPTSCKFNPRVENGCTFYDVVCDKTYRCSLPCKPGFECRIVQGVEQCLPATPEVDKCKLPKNPGPCRDNIVMWYYNYQSRRCEQFNYGGCSGNENRFQTRQICEKTCLEETDFQSPCSLQCGPGYECRFVQGFEQCVPGSTTPQECQLPRDPGPCEGYIPSWFYNTTTGRCEQFVFGGCAGNQNRFESRKHCEANCI